MKWVKITKINFGKTNPAFHPIFHTCIEYLLFFHSSTSGKDDINTPEKNRSSLNRRAILGYFKNLI